MGESKVSLLFPKKSHGNSVDAKKQGNTVLKKEPYGQKLTNRELQTVHLLSEGLSAKEIANNLSLSNRTIEMYIKNARIKCQCRNKMELAKWFFENQAKL